MIEEMIDNTAGWIFSTESAYECVDSTNLERIGDNKDGVNYIDFEIRIVYPRC